MELCVLGRLSTLRRGDQRSPYFYLSIASWVVIVATIVYHVILSRRFTKQRAKIFDKSAGPVDWVNESTITKPETGKGKQMVSLYIGTEATPPSKFLESPTDFTQPIFKAKQPTVWLPEDRIGVASAECRLLNHMYPELQADCHGASITANGRVSISGAPPEASNR
jgi:hypothetical protein